MHFRYVLREMEKMSKVTFRALFPKKRKTSPCLPGTGGEAPSASSSPTSKTPFWKLVTTKTKPKNLWMFVQSHVFFAKANFWIGFKKSVKVKRFLTHTPRQSIFIGLDSSDKKMLFQQVSIARTFHFKIAFFFCKKICCRLKKKKPSFLPPKKMIPIKKEVCNFFNASETQQKTSTKIGPVTLLGKKNKQVSRRLALAGMKASTHTQKKQRKSPSAPSHGREPLILKGVTPGEKNHRDNFVGS